MSTGQVSRRVEGGLAPQRALAAAFVLATLASAALWFIPPHTSGERIDLESLLPLLGDTATGPGSGGTPQHGVAGLVLISVPAVAGIPLLVPPAARRRMLDICAAVVGVFAVATLLRNGLLFMPSAALLCWAAWRSRAQGGQRRPTLS
jgi:hypothetical protein